MPSVLSRPSRLIRSISASQQPLGPLRAVAVNELSGFLSDAPQGSHIRILPNRVWQTWTDLPIANGSIEISPEGQAKCASELSAAFHAIKSSSSIEQASLAYSNAIELPVFHTRPATGHASNEERKPSLIFSTMGIECHHHDLGLWLFPAFPQIRVIDLDTVRASQVARAASASGGIPAWHQSVANSADSVLRAFDYTADFFSRDLIKLPNATPSKTVVDLRPYKIGYPRDKTADVEMISVGFAGAMEDNIKYFPTNEWRPNLYDELRRSSPLISCSLTARAPEGEIACITIDQELEEVPSNLAKLAKDVLRVGEDGELFIDGRDIKKRKKKS